MPVIMPFGKYKGKSVEQICLEDYKYFKGFLVNELLNKGEIKNQDLARRVGFVYHVANNFKPVKECSICRNDARYISIYYGDGYSRSSSIDFIYCSPSCFDNDPKVTPERWKIRLEKIAFNTALSKYKYDTNNLVKIIAECMGLPNQRRLTKEYLENFFNRCQLEIPYSGL